MKKINLIQKKKLQFQIILVVCLINLKTRIWIRLKYKICEKYLFNNKLNNYKLKI